MNREKMTDSLGKFLTLALFLEVYYDKDVAMYTFKEVDYEYEGKTFISLKAKYLEMADPTEYDFANTYLCGWRHWNRLVENKVIRKHIDEWREELEYKLRSQAVKQMKLSAEGGNYQAAKWFTDRGWATRGAGRPSKEAVEKEMNIQKRLGDEFSADIIRLQANQGK